MEFLYEKVYSNQYFALVLFGTIAILLVLFAIVLLAAIKDTKKRKLAELDKLEKENINALQQKADILSSDTAIFGITEAFTEESPKQPLEFFKSEDEQSKTRDIVLSTPTTENSMNNLLSEFEDEKETTVNSNSSVAPTAQDIPIVENNINMGAEEQVHEEQVHKDIVVPEIEVPIPEVQSVAVEETSVPVPQPEVVTSSVPEPQPMIMEEIPIPSPQPISEESVVSPPIEGDENIENVIPEVEETPAIEQVVEETNTLVEDNEDDFELPAIKEDGVGINLEKSINPSNISPSGIDFGKTGILNFSNIESESYEIK